MSKFSLFLSLFFLMLIQGIHATEATNISLFQPLPKHVTPELSEKGDWQVGVQTIDIQIKDAPTDFSGALAERSLTLEVWYPTLAKEKGTVYQNETRTGKPFTIATDAMRDVPVAKESAPFPVVILSHGYTGYRTLMFYLAEHLASHGYVVAAIDHTDSTNADVDSVKSPFTGFPSTLLNRSRDQQQTLNAVQNHSKFADVVDTKRAGLIGYSMGGYGAINTVGGCFAFSDQVISRLANLQDPQVIQSIKAQLNTCSAGNKENITDSRWKAMMALAPWGGQLRLFSQPALTKIRVPTLYVAGEHDDISGYQGIRWLFDNTIGTSAYLLTIKNARHNIAAHPAPTEAFENELDLGHYLEPAWRTQALNHINQHFALAMMNCHVKNQAAFCDYLKVTGNSDQANKDGKTPEPWKGFDHRYALGLSMESHTKAE